MKIRGSAAHIAGKYSSLARDASVTGDPVSSENYWQHAEHYNRIVQSAESQAQEKRQNAVAGASPNGGQRRQPNDGHAHAPDNRHGNAANGAAQGTEPCDTPGSAQDSAQGRAQGSAQGSAQESQDANSADDGNKRQSAGADKGDAPATSEAAAKPVRKRAKPGPKASAKPAVAKAETAPTEEAG